ncbi:MAG: S8 family serine peptidase [Lachnospiraceae bacterium]|nr:S8 family serine peptidase [Lachnospiraceae bacterium]
MKRVSRKFKKLILPLLLSAVMLTEPVETAVVYAGEASPVESLTEEPASDEEEALPEDTEHTGEDGMPSDGDEEKTEEAGGSSDHEDSQETPADGDNQEQDSPEENQDAGDGESQETEPGEEEMTPEEEMPEEEEPEEELPENALPGDEQEVQDEALTGQEISEEETAEKEEEAGEFPGMPDGYRLSSTQVGEKRLLADYMENVEESAEGVLYAAGEVMTLAQSEEEAEMIAGAYDAGIKSFEDGLLVLELEEQTTVRDAVCAAASARTVLPAVWPNYYRYVHGEAAQQEGGDELIEIEEQEYIPETEAALTQESDVPTSEAYARAADSFDDPYLKTTSSNYQWQHVVVGSPYVWREGYLGAGVKVAVLDSGVNASHPDLRIRENINKVTGADSAEDGYGHGTHVAGIIGAAANNGRGGCGIAPEAEIYNIRVMDGKGKGTDADIIAGLTAAIEQDVDVINMSLGGPGYNGIYQAKINEAYEAGIAVIVSAGNDGVSNINYPACYDHVICVAATDTNNSRAVFSTYGSWVDLSAPGENILSTYKTGYAFMSGTSQACPVVSGEAALLLGACEPLKSMEKDSRKVDELERVLKSNCVKAAGTGMGAGITSLTKVFKLSTAITKPTAPVIEIVPDDQNKAQKVTVTVKAQGGMTVYYTDNGKTPAFRNGEPSADAIQYSGPFSLENRAKATVKAIAVNENGVSSAVKSVSYTLKPYVTDIEISGVQQVAVGKSIQLSAEVTPAYAVNKKVKWELRNADGTALTADLANKLKISSGGKVTAGKTAPPGTYKVVATAQDDGKRTAEYEIEVISGIRVKSVKFLKEKTGKTVLKSVNLSLPVQETYDLARHLVPEPESGSITLTAADFKWTSSNRLVAEVDGAGVVTAKKAGKVTITALANDSSNKKAACTVTVKQLATDIKVSGPASVAAGKSVTLKAEVTPKDTANKKVVWSLYDASGEVTKERAKALGVSVNAANGRLTVKAGAVGGDYTVKAVTSDGSSLEAETPVRVLDGCIEKLAFSDRKDARVTLYRKKSASDTQTEKTVSVVIKGKGSADLDAYKVTSSNQGIATVEQSRSGNEITLTVRATGRAAGKTNITVVSTDGTNRKLTCLVTVLNPVSRLHISSKTITAFVGGTPKVDMCVVQGRSIQLKATPESEYGKVSNKNVTWSIDAPADSGVKISASGRVTAAKTAWTGNSYIWTVTAVAKDGSNVKDTYRVMAVPKATYVQASKLYEGRVINKYDDYFPNTADGIQKGYEYTINTDVKGGYVQASSSNKKIVEVTIYKKDGELKLWVTPRKPGTATITLKVTDGSGVKTSYKMLVSEKET